VKKQYGRDVPGLLTDRNQLRQVLLNLLNNAIDAIGEGPGTIAIETSFDGRAIRVSVGDSGKGIPADQLDKIFMPFFTTKEVGKGTGLGLSVSYGIVKSLGGHMEVKSTVGSGSTFTIVLPTR
jgi:two-component system NtrC family sensor kinase